LAAEPEETVDDDIPLARLRSRNMKRERQNLKVALAAYIATVDRMRRVLRGYHAAALRRMPDTEEDFNKIHEAVVEFGDVAASLLRRTIEDRTIKELIEMAEAFKEERKAEKAAKDARSSLEQIRDERKKALFALEGSTEEEETMRVYLW
jgi:hypothetical protein